MRHVDLCSGIGGFALGFEWAGLSKPVLFCDIEPWSRKIIRKHWHDVPIAEDVKELANDPERTVPDCDILTAGYPCQPFSQAGKRKGEEDPRHIFPYIMQIVASKRPSWCVFENVYGHVSMGLDTALTAMEAEGYATRTFIIPAVSVGAPHRRDRIFIVGRFMGDTEHNGSPAATLGRSTHEASNDEPQGKETSGKSKGTGGREDGSNVAHPDGDDGGHGSSTESQGRKARVEHRGGGERQPVRQPDQNVAHPDSTGLQGHGREHELRSPSKEGEIIGSSDVAYSDSERRCGGDTQRQDAEDVGQPPRDSWSVTGGVETWGVEPDVGRVANGIPKRVDRIRGLGNAIVPQIAKQIGLAIKETENDRKGV